MLVVEEGLGLEATGRWDGPLARRLHDAMRLGKGELHVEVQEEGELQLDAVVSSFHSPHEVVQARRVELV